MIPALPLNIYRVYCLRGKPSLQLKKAGEKSQLDFLVDVLPAIQEASFYLTAGDP